MFSCNFPQWHKNYKINFKAPISKLILKGKNTVLLKIHITEVIIANLYANKICKGDYWQNTGVLGIGTYFLIAGYLQVPRFEKLKT